MKLNLPLLETIVINIFNCKKLELDFERESLKSECLNIKVTSIKEALLNTTYNTFVKDAEKEIHRTDQKLWCIEIIDNLDYTVILENAAWVDLVHLRHDFEGGIHHE